ncbi:MAG TPA: hypothetical protein EYG03_08825 [Planctomycetes bacterium]|nr:hypothetical protein [Fuerstiella sp.]HIK92068.1 hypothetical protein [Planctomycetota bacterium]
MAGLNFHSEVAPPTDLPAEARAGFNQARNEAYRNGIPVGGIQILRSPVLTRAFPDYSFVRVDLTYRHRSNAYDQPTHVYAIPLDGGPNHHIRWDFGDAMERIARLLVDAKFKLLTEQDAELLQHTLRELSRRDRVFFAVKLVRQQEWSLGKYTDFTLTTNSDGIVSAVRKNRR